MAYGDLLCMTLVAKMRAQSVEITSACHIVRDFVIAQAQGAVRQTEELPTTGLSERDVLGSRCRDSRRFHVSVHGPMQPRKR